MSAGRRESRGFATASAISMVADEPYGVTGQSQTDMSPRG